MDFKRFLPHLIAVAIFFVAVLVIFAPQFKGKSLPKGDITSFIASSHETTTYRQETGEPVLWTGTSFGGMPTFQVSKPDDGNKLRNAASLFYGFMARPAGYFFAGMLCCYLLLVLIGIDPWLSIAGALGAGLATNGFVLFEAGHMSKVMTVFYLPLVAVGIILAFQKKYIWGGLAFAFGMGVAIAANHPQMLYYFGITLPFFGVARFIHDFKAGELAHFGKATAVLVIGLLLAVGSGAGLLWITTEYTAETIRGGQKLETPVKAPNASASDAPQKGLEWDYAMEWSNGLKDILATYSPLAAGGGSGQEISNKTPIAKELTKLDGRRLPSTFPFRMYHGALPFTEGPAYLGAVVWALFIFGLFAARRPVAWWLGGGTFFIFLISMGKNVEGINHFLYDFLPLLNKFRAPSSALSISTFMMVVLGVIGVQDWLKTLEDDEAKARKTLLMAGGTAAVLGLLITVIVPSFIDFTAASDVRIFPADNPATPRLLEALVDTRQELYSADAWRSFLFVGLTFGALFLMFRKMANPLIGGLLLAALITVDFNGVNKTRMQDKDWQRTPSRSAPAFPKTAADATILQDPDPHYRVYNVAANPLSDAKTSYYHKNIGGYSAVRMRRIQDIFDGYLNQNNQNVLNMLNAKWFILPGGEGQPPRAQQNPAAFGNAWLVSSIQQVPTNDAEFAALGATPNLKGTAIVHQDFSEVVAGLQPNGSGTVQLTKYTPDELSYTFNSPSEQLVVFSEMWYGPDLGWTATIDGQPAELIRANYLLRALRVPAGQHEIVMTFAPSSYFTGKAISLICSLMVILGLIGYGVYEFLQGRKTEE